MKTRIIQDEPEPTRQGPPSQRSNIAGRMARWSAHNRKKAIFGRCDLDRPVRGQHRLPDEADRVRDLRAGGVGPNGQDPLRGLQAARGRGRPHSTSDADGRRPGVPEDRASGDCRSRSARRNREGGVSARRRKLGPDLERQAFGVRGAEIAGDPDKLPTSSIPSSTESTSYRTRTPATTSGRSVRVPERQSRRASSTT